MVTASKPRNITGRPGVSKMLLAEVACGPMTCYSSEASLKKGRLSPTATNRHLISQMQSLPLRHKTSTKSMTLRQSDKLTQQTVFRLSGTENVENFVLYIYWQY